MKLLLCLSLSLLVPIFCRGESVSLTDARDWKPIAESQKDALLDGKKIRFIDGSIYATGGKAVFAILPVAVTSKRVYDQEAAGYIQGATGHGFKLIGQQTETLAELPGICFMFQGEVDGSDMFVFAYQFFTTREIYAITFYTSTLIDSTDPMVTSYLARIKLDPSVKPGNIHEFSLFGDRPKHSGPAWNDTSAYAIGYRMGQLLVVLFLVSVFVLIVATIVRRSRKQTPTPPPLPRL